MTPKGVLIHHLRTSNCRGHRVTAEVDGHEVWFESEERSLCVSGEAFGSALLLPALYAGARLQLERPVCPRWQAGAGAVVALANQWWHLPLLPPETRPLAAPSVAHNTGTALCFTGGLDSFHSLLRGQHRPTLLVFVHGFDIALADEIRLRAFLPSLEQVAAARGARAVVIRTNLREHPLLRAAPWIYTHGGALAAIGHLLGDHVARLVIASSVPRSYHIPWGSHWQLDPLWSSGGMAITHEGDDFSREQKAWAVADEPLLMRHLRVCWENHSPTGNCSFCDKCVNTMMLLQQAGMLAAYPVFQQPPSFVPLLDALPKTTFVRVYRAMCRRGLPPELESAVQRLLRRTERLAARREFRSRIRRGFGRLWFRHRN